MASGRFAPRRAPAQPWRVLAEGVSQETIDLTLRTHAGLQTRIVESPGLSLPQEELDHWSRICASSPARPCRPASLTYGIFSGERERLSRAIVTLICEEATGRPIAFNALSVMAVELDGEQEKSPISASSWSILMCRGRGCPGCSTA